MTKEEVKKQVRLVLRAANWSEAEVDRWMGCRIQPFDDRTLDEILQAEEYGLLYDVLIHLLDSGSVYPPDELINPLEKIAKGRRRLGH